MATVDCHSTLCLHCTLYHSLPRSTCVEGRDFTPQIRFGVRFRTERPHRVRLSGRSVRKTSGHGIASYLKRIHYALMGRCLRPYGFPSKVYKYICQIVRTLELFDNNAARVAPTGPGSQPANSMTSRADHSHPSSHTAARKKPRTAARTPHGPHHTRKGGHIADSARFKPAAGRTS